MSYQTWKDEHKITRLINHNQEPINLERTTPSVVMLKYLQVMTKEYELQDEWTKNISEIIKVSSLKDEKSSIYFEKEKLIKGGKVLTYRQTFAGIPTWAAGITIVLREAPNRILSSTNTLYYDLEVKELNEDNLLKFKKLEVITLAKLLGLNEIGKLKINRISPYIFKYDKAKRFGNADHDTSDHKNWFEPFHPTLPLAKIDDNIRNGGYYLCVEVLFSLPLKNSKNLNWRAFIEVNTGQVLYCEAATDNASGLVFKTDPGTQTGNMALNPDSTNATLNPLRTAVTLPGLIAPVGAQQALTGEFIAISDVEVFTVPPPTAAAPPADFNYNSRTNNFAAVNAYYHCDAFFRYIQNLGFIIGDYFDGTNFPLQVDHRGRFLSADGIEINASCNGTVGIDGISMVDFELATLTDNAANPMGLACDWRVVLHELGGHGILWDHVSHANFGFAHSAGDSFASILNDPETMLIGADRFLTFPWVSGIINRRHDRAVAAGWGWGGVNDSSGYKREEILNTSNFRIYRALGGDSSHLSRRLFASKFTAYLILKAVESLTPMSNPANAALFEGALESADGFDFDPINPAEHHASGAYHKVIRWGFEKQGLFRPAGAANTTEGAPPAVDVYINDGRNGEYQFLGNHWNCQDIWNRLMPDGLGGHEEPVTGQTNFAYVRIKNRGTSQANNVEVKGFHCLPGVGLVYPTDWQPMDTPQLSAPNIAANDAVGLVIGPFEWTPSQVGHECMFFSVSATNDPSNIDGRVTGPIPEWRLVPNDNNIGQRNVHPVAGGGGAAGLLESFQNLPFWVRNPERRKAKISFQVELPDFLKERKWSLVLPRPFSIAGKKMEKVMPKLKKGKEFSPAEVKESKLKEITITVLINGLPFGGMTYYIDINKKV